MTMRQMWRALAYCGAGVVLIGAIAAGGAGADGNAPVAASSAPPARTGVLFDDFQYRDTAAMIAHGWTLRAGTGWPGITGAAWRSENVTFEDDPERPGNRVLRMTSTTDGTHTTQTQICHQRKYLEGTYATRVRFNDEPASGPDGDQIVETFYTISPLKAPMDPDYSEMDFEYLANGGWGGASSLLDLTTWRTFSPAPNPQHDNVSDRTLGSLKGWHTLVLQVAKGQVTYFVDGRAVAKHGGRYYPRSAMSINFNLWFIEGGLIRAGSERRYQEDVDWVFHAAGQALTPAEVEARVAALRQASVPFQDTVPAWSPPLPCPCDL